MWPALAAFASLFLPGTGQALTGDRLRTLIWAVAGFVLVIACLWLPQFLFVRTLLGIASAIDAVIVVRRARRASIAMDLVAGSASLIGQIAVVLVLRLLVMESFVAQSTSMAPTVTIGDHVLVNKIGPRFGGYHRGDIVVFRHPGIGIAYVKRIGAVGGDEVAVRDGVLYVNGHAESQTEVGPVSYWDSMDVGHDDWHKRDVIAYREDLDGDVHIIYRVPRMPSETVDSHDFPRAHGPGEAPGDPDPCAWANPSQTYGATHPQEVPRMHLARDGKSCAIPPGTYFMLGDNRDNSNDSRYWGVVPSANMIGRVVGIWYPGKVHGDEDFSRIGRID